MEETERELRQEKVRVEVDETGPGLEWISPDRRKRRK